MRLGTLKRLIGAQGRGTLFFGGVAVYEGMVVGQNSKDEDIAVNVCKFKQLTNFHAGQSRAAEQLSVPRNMSLENALDYIGDDEIVEITPKNLRIRKMFLDANNRKRQKSNASR
jgi:GTP-binding protein